jgi:hypothetical protein
MERSHIDKYKEITNDWNYDASCMLTSLPILYLRTQSVLAIYEHQIQINGVLLILIL